MQLQGHQSLRNESELAMTFTQSMFCARARKFIWYGYLMAPPLLTQSWALDLDGATPTNDSSNTGRPHCRPFAIASQ